MLIQLKKLVLAPGGTELLNDASWTLHDNKRVGIVGRNGSGKTTLLRCIMQEVLPFSGQVKKRPRILIGYLPQTAVSGSQKTLWEEVKLGLLRLQDLRQDLLSAETAMQNDEDGSIERYSHLLERWNALGGFSEEEQIGRVLHGLGFAPSDWHKSCDTFSGGWQMRIALAKLLLTQPDVAIMDEPTNHLDLHARTWLANHLSSVPYSLMVVSHDRYFLNRVSNVTLEIRGKKLHQYSGNINFFLKERDLRIAQAQATYDKQETKRAHLQGFIDRFGAKATKAKQAQSRKKQLDGMDVIDSPMDDTKHIHIRFQEGQPSSPIAIRLKGVNIGWTRTLLENVTLDLQRGMRLALIGANGSGKSTLLKTLTGEIQTLGGRVEYGDRVLLGIFHQDLAQALPHSDTALEYILNECPHKNAEEIRNTLGALGLKGESHLREIGQLSGGEKARVALCSLISSNTNVLLLDEPTNHLDIETSEALIKALQHYEGAVCFISHDRSLVEEASTHVGRLDGKKLDIRQGLAAEWLIPPPFTNPDQKSEELKNNRGKQSYLANKEREQKRRALHKSLNKCETTIEDLELRLTTIDEELSNVSTNFEAAQRLGDERNQMDNELQIQLSKWESISEEIEAFDL